MSYPKYIIFGYLKVSHLHCSSAIWVEPPCISLAEIILSFAIDNFSHSYLQNTRLKPIDWWKAIWRLINNLNKFSYVTPYMVLVCKITPTISIITDMFYWKITNKSTTATTYCTFLTTTIATKKEIRKLCKKKWKRKEERAKELHQQQQYLEPYLNFWFGLLWIFHVQYDSDIGQNC